MIQKGTQKRKERIQKDKKKNGSEKVKKKAVQKVKTGSKKL